MATITSPLLEIAAVFSVALSGLGNVRSPVLEIAAAHSVTLQNMGVVRSPVLAIAGGHTVEVDALHNSTPRSGLLEIAAAATVEVFGVVPTQAATIRAAVQDILRLWGFGCCSEPSECVLAEAIRCVNTGLQQFYQSTRAHQFLVNARDRTYSFSPAGENAYKFFSNDGVELPTRRPTDYPAGNVHDHETQHVARVTYYTGDAVSPSRIALRPVAASAASQVFGASVAMPGGCLLEWLDTPASNVPLYYEVFTTAAGVRKIRGWPYVTVPPGDDTLVDDGDYYTLTLDGDTAYLVKVVPDPAPSTPAEGTLVDQSDYWSITLGGVTGHFGKVVPDPEPSAPAEGTLVDQSDYWSITLGGVTGHLQKVDILT